MTVAGLLAAAALGALLGAAYFGGLWWTVARLGRWRRPAVALLASFVARNALALAVFAALARLGVAPPLMALAGFVAARWLLSGWLRPPAAGPGRSSLPDGPRGG